MENDANVAKKCPRRRLIDGRTQPGQSPPCPFAIPTAAVPHSAAQLDGRAYAGLAIWQATWTRLQSFFMATDCIEYFVRNKIQIYLR